MKKFFLVLSALFILSFAITSTALGYATLGFKWGGYNPAYPTQYVSFRLDQLPILFYTPTANGLSQWTNSGGAKFYYSVNNNSSNTVIYDWLYGDATYALGYTQNWDNGAGAIVQSQITLNERYDAVWSTSPTSSQYDIQSVSTHELGHSLGLNHSSTTGATMSYPYTQGATWMRSIESDDIAGIKYLYGSR